MILHRLQACTRFFHSLYLEFRIDIHPRAGVNWGHGLHDSQSVGSFHEMLRNKGRTTIDPAA